MVLIFLLGCEGALTHPVFCDFVAVSCERGDKWSFVFRVLLLGIPHGAVHHVSFHRVFYLVICQSQFSG
jgi:hypothetical protein